MKQTEWHKAILIGSAPGVKLVQYFDSGEFEWIARETNQRQVDPEHSIILVERDVEKDVKPVSSPYLRVNAWTEPGELG